MSNATQRLLKKHPNCCFCGGTVGAENRDHQPARILFPDKIRPKGLEFSACKICNVQTSPDEALVAVLVRAAGNLRYPQGRLDKGLKRAFQAVQHSFPGLLDRIATRVWVNHNGVLQSVLAFNGNNAQVEASVCRVAAKLSLATYYEDQGIIEIGRAHV